MSLRGRPPLFFIQQSEHRRCAPNAKALFPSFSKDYPAKINPVITGSKNVD